ncbi:TPA: hypothetical protein R8G81_002973 [Citrobacter youngae]|nr:hypothetical protein [Citrobacter youngae]
MAKKPNRRAWQPPVRWLCLKCHRQYCGERMCPYCYSTTNMIAATVN